MDYKEGSVVKAKIIKPQKNGFGFVVALEPGNNWHSQKLHANIHSKNLSIQ